MISPSQELHFREFSRFCNDPAYFILGEGNKHWCYTFDELSRANRVAFPRYNYHRLTVETFRRESRIALAKSRQMMATWLISAFALHQAMFTDAQTIGIQSQHEEQSKFHLENKVLYIYRNLEPWIKAQCPISFTKKQIDFPRTNSRIIAFQQGEAALRGYTISMLFGDELQSQALAEPAFAASMPTMIGRAEKQGKYIAVGTAMDKCFFKKLVIGSNKAWIQTPIRGYSMKRNPDTNFLALRLHYSADAAKDGLWVARNKPTMNVGDSNKWQREMEIDFDVTSGMAYFPEYTPRLAERTNLQAINGLPLKRSWDFGRESPACVILQYNPQLDQVALLREFSMPGENLYNFSDGVLRICNDAYPGFEWEDYCDVAGTQGNDKSDDTSIKVLESKGVSPIYARLPKEKGFSIWRGWMMWEAGRMHPGFIVDVNECPIAVRGLRGAFTYKQGREGSLTDYAKVHPIIDVMDAIKYCMALDSDLSFIGERPPKNLDEPDPQNMSIDEYKDWHRKTVLSQGLEDEDYSGEGAIWL